MKWLGVVGAAFVLCCGQASASTVISADSGTSWPYQRWVERMKVPTPDVTVTVVENTDRCSYPALGCTDGSTIWLMPTLDARFTFRHEVGHIFDQQVTAVDGGHLQRRFSEITRQPYDLERFANTYALCSERARFPRTWVGGYLGYRKARAVCPMIRAAASRTQAPQPTADAT